VFPWGDDLEPEGEHRMNVWQGDFPATNTLDDGFLGLAPVGAFEPNGFGLYHMTGNVWEWTRDWFHPTFRRRDRRRDPLGPVRGTHKVQKGGSYLCHHSYCRRYRVAARQGGTPDSSTGNVGFRCARSA
jgi:formylglycine-generating enzyme